MPTYYYQFAITSSPVDVEPITNLQSHDIGTEFNNDSRGTARVADWSELPTTESAYDIFVEVLALSNDSNALVSWNDSTYSNGSKWYWVQNGSSNRFFYFINNNTNANAFLHGNISITNGKKLSLGSWTSDRRALVYFPNYQANGGHSALIINNSISVTWNSSNSRFQSFDSSTTLSHNGTTWVINNNGTSSTASLNSSNIGSYVDPASSDIVWQNNSSVTTPSAGAQGDPHINPILGNPYTI